MTLCLFNLVARLNGLNFSFCGRDVTWCAGRGLHLVIALLETGVVLKVPPAGINFRAFFCFLGIHPRIEEVGQLGHRWISSLQVQTNGKVLMRNENYNGMKAWRL